MQRSVCVYCGSRPGADPAFPRDAEAMGRGLAEAGLRLVYAAGDGRPLGSRGRSAQGAGGGGAGFPGSR